MPEQATGRREAYMTRLEQIDEELARYQAAYKAATLQWFRIKREREHARAAAFMRAEGSVAERNAFADVEMALTGKEEEAAYQSLHAVVRTLEKRASIGQSLLKAESQDQ